MTGFVDQNTLLTKDSHILTLSTCNAYDDQRYLVQCLLMNPEVLPKTDSTTTTVQDGAAEEAQTGR